MNSLIMITMILLMVIVNLPATSLASSPTISNGIAQRVAAPLRPALGELRVSKTPVLLPTWLPPMGPYKYTGLCSYPGDGYEISLGLTPDACTADTKFYLYGGKGVLAASSHKVDLGKGRVGYLKSNLIEWAEGKYRYGIGLGLYYPNKQKTADALIRSAQSRVCVPLEEMRKAPRSNDRLAKSYALERTLKHTDSKETVAH